VSERFGLDGSKPTRIEVRNLTPPGHATQQYGVIAVYSWAERILASGCYLRDANDIAATVAEHLSVNVSLRSEEAPGG